jgi:hypothetical protein
LSLAAGYDQVIIDGPAQVADVAGGQRCPPPRRKDAKRRDPHPSIAEKTLPHQDVQWDQVRQAAQHLVEDREREVKRSSKAA